MARKLYPALLALLLYSTSPVFGSPAPAPQPAAPAEPTKTATGKDGFLRTSSYLQTAKKTAAGVEAVLKTLQGEAVAAAPNDAQQQRSIFLKKLADRYPGATFNGTAGTAPIQQAFVALFNGALKVESIRENGPITLTYLVTRGQIQLAYENSTITVMVDENTPERSSFINVSIPVIRDEAEKIVIDPDRKRIASDSAEAAVLNDAYQLLSLTSNQRMDIFAAQVLQDKKVQQQVLKVAANGYRERHAQDYRAADPAQLKKKKVDTKPNKPAESRFYEGFIKLFAFILLAAGVLWGVFKGIRSLQSLSTSRNNPHQMRENQYRTLTPMVKRALNRRGRALWGRNLPWAKHYYIYERKNRWILCDGREEKEKKIFQAHTRIEVCLRTTYFKIKITRLHGASANIWLHCHDLSQSDLYKGLEEICLEMTNPSGRDDGVDADEAADGSSVPLPEPASEEKSNPNGDDVAEATQAATDDRPVESETRQGEPDQEVSREEETCPALEVAPIPVGDDTPTVAQEPLAHRTEQGEQRQGELPVSRSVATGGPRTPDAAAAVQPATEAGAEVTGADQSDTSEATPARRRPPKKSLTHPARRYW